MSFKILATVRGKLICELTHPDDIEINEPHVKGKQLLTDNPHLIVVDSLSENFNFIKWFKTWDSELRHKYEGTIPNYNIRMLALSTLNDIYDDPLIHKKYKENDFVELSGEVGTSRDRRFKIGRRIFYNWFVTELSRLHLKHTSADWYLYMEICATIEKTEDT